MDRNGKNEIAQEDHILLKSTGKQIRPLLSRFI